MTTYHHVEVNGKPIRDGETVEIDHSIVKFEVTIRAINTVSPSIIKRLLQEKFEVLDVQETDLTCMVKSLHRM